MPFWERQTIKAHIIGIQQGVVSKHLTWTENEQGEDDTMNKRYKEEDLSMVIKRKHQKKDPENVPSE